MQQRWEERAKEYTNSKPVEMFGAVCSGRPVQLASQVEPNKYVINIPNGSNVNYVTIFLLPNTEFDNNFTAMIYFQLPNSAEFQLLGGINGDKPSAIYKLNNGAGSLNNIDDLDMNVDESASALNIGISIEPTLQVQGQLDQLRASKTTVKSTALVSTSSTTNLANKVVGHAYNYLASFIDESGKVPIKAFDNWWDKFKTKLRNNPNFIDELQD
mgnify:CR=1 FL=1